MSEEEKSMIDGQQSTEETSDSSETPAITEVTPLNTYNLQPTTPMEVHHHPHVEKNLSKNICLKA